MCIIFDSAFFNAESFFKSIIMYKKLVVVFFVSLLLVRCGGSDDDSSNDGEVKPVAYDRGKMLVHWADKIIVPAHNAFKLTLTDLDTSTKTFVASQINLTLTILDQNGYFLINHGNISKCLI